MIMTLPHSVTVVHPGVTTDRYNNEIADWDAGTTDEGVPGWVQQRASTVEVSPGRTAQVTQWVLYLQAGTVIADHDKVTWDGREFEVDGEPRQAIGPAGTHHIVAALKTVDG